MRILVVEDEPTLATQLVEGIQSVGYVVDVATGELAGEAAALGRVQVNAIERTFAAPTPAHPLDVTVGQTIALRGSRKGGANA